MEEGEKSMRGDVMKNKIVYFRKISENHFEAILKPRPEIIEFAEAMEKVMSRNDKEKGDSWKTCDMDFLVNKLKEEIREWEEDNDYNERYGLSPADMEELVDIANVCMMLFQRIKEKITTKKESGGDERRI